MNIAFGSFLRSPVAGEPQNNNNNAGAGAGNNNNSIGNNGGANDADNNNTKVNTSDKQRHTRNRVKDDQMELRRLADVLFAFMRQALREQRHGYQDRKGVPDSELLDKDAVRRCRLNTSG